jgi:DNA-binding response OmpR family regulator
MASPRTGTYNRGMRHDTTSDTARRGTDGERERLAIVCEDEPLIAELVGIWLEELGFRVEVTTRADEAFLLLARAGRLDLLVADHNLRTPTTGADLIRGARAVHPHLPAILMSGTLDAATARRMDLHFIGKPLRAAEFLAAVRLFYPEPRDAAASVGAAPS